MGAKGAFIVHKLTLLYHLTNNGPRAKEWQGVGRLLQAAGLNTVPKADVAVFVGTLLVDESGDDTTRAV